MSLANVFANNTVYADDPRNLIITNDLTTGNILFTSERPTSLPKCWERWWPRKILALATASLAFASSG